MSQLPFVVTIGDQNTKNSRQAAKQMLRTQPEVLICCNLSLTLSRHNQVLSPSCQSQCMPKLFISLSFIYDNIFPCRLKVSKSQLTGRNRAAKAFHRNTGLLLSFTQAEESCGMWSSHSADKPYHLYIASIMERS